MRIPTVTIRNKKTGATFIVNEVDYAQNRLPGMDVRFGAGDWERVSETQGESNPIKEKEAETIRAENAKVADSLVKKSTPSVAVSKK